MSSERPKRSTSQSVDEQAVQWLARRDRGFTSAEQDSYLQWLREDARHAAALARQAETFRQMMRLADWRPELGSEPNPDLFAPRRRYRRWQTSVLAAAAALTIGLFAWRQSAPLRPPERPPQSHLRFNERQRLPDGSLVELRDGSKISFQFSSTERRILLSGGEALFTVAKNHDWPFVVYVNGVRVRAVGTAFDVRPDSGSVVVLVTEGKVQLEGLAKSNQPAAAAPTVAAGQRATVLLAAAGSRPEVTDLTPTEIKEALAWQAPHIQFFDTPLGEAVAEFNRHNHQQLVLGEPALNTALIGGTFRIDNVEGFVRGLGIALGVRAERRPNGDILLTRAR